MEFKDFVEARMRKVGISSFRQLAFKMDIAPSNIGRIMINPTYERMCKFASALGCDLWELLRPDDMSDDSRVEMKDRADWIPKDPVERKIDRIFIEYSDGSADRFTRDPDVID